jgi:predicted  nucleic acid-binding Zn-ribbon protein
MLDLPTTVRNLLTRETFYVIGNVFSIASFILSIFVLWNIRKLRNAYRLRVRGPSLIRDLSKAASNLSKFMNDFDEFVPQVSQELGKAGVKLNSLKRKLTGDPKKSVKRVIQYIDQCKVNVQNEEQVRLVYVEILKIIEELKDYQKDLDWEM